MLETQTRSGAPVDLAEPRWLFGAGLGVQYNVLGIPGGAGQVQLEIARRLDRADENRTYRLGLTIER